MQNMRRFEAVASRLERLVDEGSFSAKAMVSEKAAEQVLCVITIPYAKGSADALRIRKQVAKVVRKSDYVRNAFGAVQVIGLTTKEGAYQFLQKVQGVITGRDVYCTAIQDTHLLEDSEVARIAVGMELPKKNAYLSRRKLTKDDVEQYAGLVRALHPRVLEKLKVVIAKSDEVYDRLDWTKTPNGSGFITHKGPAYEGELEYHDRPESFVVGLEHEKERVRYDERKMMLKRSYRS